MRCCDQVWSTDRRSLQPHNRNGPLHGSIVYAKRDHFGSLFKELRCSRARVVLLTAESDDAVSARERVPHQVAAWFSTNSLHQRAHPMPLGLGNSYCPVSTKAPDLAEAHGAAKTNLLYINFRPSTNIAARQPLWESYEKAEREGWATRRRGDIAGRDYALELARHRFALCPPGNGIDTHRLWEALYVGTIPVVQRSPALETFADLPILFVDNLATLNRQFLEEQARMIEQRNDWNMPKLFLPFWRDFFERAREAIGRPLSVAAFIASKLEAARVSFPARFRPQRS